MKVHTFEEAMAAIGDKKPTLLLGNGFSIACDTAFAYGSLYEEAKRAGLSNPLVELFEKIGTNDFERVLRLLDDAEMVAKAYGVPFPGAAAKDREILKRTLVQVISKHHLPDPYRVEQESWLSVREFLGLFQDVFTTNYDLLLYWANLREYPCLFTDGFSRDPEGEYLYFSGPYANRARMWHLHGALHHFFAAGLVFKHSWKDGGLPLTSLIRAAVEEGHYPVFVAEGDSQKKLEQIRRNPYLTAAFDAFCQVKGALVSFGFKFGDTDRHLAGAIESNSSLSHLAVGLHRPGSKDALAAQSCVEELRDNYEGDELEVTYFDTATTAIW